MMPLRWHHFKPGYLPPCSPNFKPIKRFWLRVKKDFFADAFCPKGDELEARILTALTLFLPAREKVASQCRISENFWESL